MIICENIFGGYVRFSFFYFRFQLSSLIALFLLFFFQKIVNELKLFGNGIIISFKTNVISSLKSNNNIVQLFKKIWSNKRFKKKEDLKINTKM